jgi:small GTP-binding protein
MYGKTLKVQIWDCAGSACPEKMTKAFYKGAIGAVIVYDVTNRQSFDNVQKTWLKQMHAFGSKDIKSLLVANKSDLHRTAPTAPTDPTTQMTADGSAGDAEGEISISTEDGNALAQVLGLPFAHVSAKDGNNVMGAVNWLVYALAKNVTELHPLMLQHDLPNGWVAEHGPDDETPSYLNMFTGSTQAAKPTATVFNLSGATVRIPSTMIKRPEPTMVTRASFSALSVDKTAVQQGGIYEYIPKCCVMQ